MNFWTKIESQLNQRIPDCIKKVLELSGFNNELGLEILNESNLLDAESYIQTNHRDVINNLTCCHSDHYKTQTKFQFVPGHRALILSLPEKLKQNPSPVTLNTICEQLIDRSSSLPMITELLKEFLKIVVKNAHASKSQFRYSEIINYFSAYIYMLSGRQCYEILSHNLPLPTAPTVLKHIHTHKKKITEGSLRCEELVSYLDSTNSPRVVWLAEDGTGIIQKIVYDTASNQLIGIVLPTSKNGMPITLAFTVKTMDEIEEYMKKQISTIAYIVMAQPIKQGVPPFLLQIFGSDNKFKSSEVMNRWQYTKSELNRFGIVALGMSTDGDPRMLRCMKNQIKFQINPLCVYQYERFLESDTSYSQDPTHVGTKLRNRLLKPSILLPVGNKQVTVGHLKMLIETVSKDVHGLVAKDISPEDRQNFGSLQKLMEPRVEESLKNFIPNSEATIAFIQICRYVTSSYLDINLTPIDRIFRMWYAVYFLRAWKKWLIKNDYSLDEHFITANAFQCIEINAHCLLSLVIRLRVQNQESLFHPTLFDSQTCERFFRQLRSMTTINFTRINFSMNDMLHLIERIELQYEIIYNKLSNTGIIFPRIKIDDLTDIVFKMPANEEIATTVKRAQNAALDDIKKLGIKMNGDEIENCDLKTIVITDDDADDQLNENMIGYESEEEDFEEIEEITDYLPDTSSEATSQSKYIRICEKDGEEKYVRKSSIVWLLSEPTKKLSNDRLKRVQMVSAEMANKRTKRPKTVDHQGGGQDTLNEISYELRVGQWVICWFQSEEENWDLNWADISSVPFKELVRNIVIGAIFAFRYTDGKTTKEKQCSLDTVLVTNDSSIKKVDILSTWYKVNENGELYSFDNNNYYVDSKQFIDAIEKKFIVTNCNENKISVDICHIKEKVLAAKKL